jgi:NAD/NADP transhydrogenase beta subunit
MEQPGEGHAVMGQEGLGPAERTSEIRTYQVLVIVGWILSFAAIYPPVPRLVGVVGMYMAVTATLRLRSLDKEGSKPWVVASLLTLIAIAVIASVKFALTRQ